MFLPLARMGHPLDLPEDATQAPLSTTALVELHNAMHPHFVLHLCVILECNLRIGDGCAGSSSLMASLKFQVF